MIARAKGRIVWKISIFIGAALLLGTVSPLIPYKTVRSGACPVSGSIKFQYTWLGFFSYERGSESALQRWLQRREPSFEPQWQFHATETYYLFGGHSWSCGKPPPVTYFQPILDRLVEKMSEEKIAALVAVLRSGSRDKQMHTLQSVSDEVFDVQ